MAMCPFCSAVALTFTEQINEQQVAVVAKLIEKPEPPSADSYDFPDGKFEIVGVLKGKELVTTGMTFKTQIVGVYPVGQKFLVMGQGVPDISWTTPIKATERVFEYLQEIRKLPESGPDRLVFFQQYFEDKEKILAFDAYDEFAAAPYEDLLAMKDQMQREKLLEYIQSPKTTINRRRLYFTMLGVCGQTKDIEMLEGLIKSDSRKQQAGLDALIGCYLKLNGKKGLPLIVEKFLGNEDADYVDLTNVMEALRFMATETDVLSTDDIVPAVRTILDHPDHADIVIEDLARWGDWSVMEKLVKRFKNLDEDSNWQRVPILAYLLECPKPEAVEHLKELKKIDPQAFERASFYRNIGDIDDDDWGDEEPLDTESPSPASGELNEGDALDQPAAAPAAEGNTAPTTPTVFRDDKVRAALAEVALVVEGADVSKNRIELAHASEAFHLADQPLAEPQLANVLIEVPEKTVANALQPIAKDSSTAGTSPSTALPQEQPRSMAEPESDRSVQQVAAASRIPSVQQDSAANSTSWALLFRVISIPIAASFLILGLMWSVVNGWFERLIF